jgi:hypothetical protein
MPDKRLDVLKSMKDHYDHLFSRLHYLLVGNGAGFAGGLTILKDYTSTPQYRGVGRWTPSDPFPPACGSH